MLCILLPADGDDDLVLQADMLLLAGTCIVDESVLTGETGEAWWLHAACHGQTVGWASSALQHGRGCVAHGGPLATPPHLQRRRKHAAVEQTDSALLSQHEANRRLSPVPSAGESTPQWKNPVGEATGDEIDASELEPTSR